MTVASLPHLNMTKLDDAAKVLPESPAITSHHADWNGVYLAQYRQVASETCEHTMQQHVLDVSELGHSVWHERWVDGKLYCYDLGNGAIDFCPAGATHRAYWQGEVHFLLLAIDPAFFRQVLNEVEIDDCQSLSPKLRVQDPLLRHLSWALRNDLVLGCPSGAIYGETMGRSLVLQLLTANTEITPQFNEPKYATDTLPQSTLNAVRDYINVHLDQDIRLADLAAIARLSPTYFCRRFKQLTGYTPHQYLVRQRVARAQQLLQQGQMSLVEVALICGFGSQSLLNRHFKRIMGVTPGSVR